MPLSGLMARKDRFYSYDHDDDGENEEDNEDNDDEDYHRDDDDDDDDDDDEVATLKSTATHDAKKLNMKMTLSKRGWRDLSSYIETPFKMQKVGLAMLNKSSKLQY